ncbi:MAG: hypothetical protein E6H95_12810 [Chloroflexi bacterium]|nr:MAG: hypothetical protein E6H95_12810 [Chloroflexota bacterium]
MDDLEVGRLHGFVSRGDGSFQVGVLAHRGAGLHDQLGRGLELRRRRLAARRGPDVSVRGLVAGCGRGPLDRGCPPGDVA